jgi:hypothetical protein
MSIFVLSINDPSIASKHAEVAFIRRAVDEAMREIGRGNGTVTSGSIIGQSATGVPNTSLGSWTYSPSASLP